jgi:hypothetical protein
MLATRLLVFGATVGVVLAATLLSVRGRDAARVALDVGCQRPCAPFNIVWVGDILLGDAAQPYLDEHGYEWPFDRVRPLLANAFVIGNAEGPITDRDEDYFPNARWSYSARPPAAAALANVGFQAIGLSNNHALDRGPEGLLDTLRHADEAGLQTFGAGMSEDEAAAPLFVETGYGAVAILGFGKAWGTGAVAGPEHAGTVPYTAEAITRLKHSAVAAGARWVVAYVHWGENYGTVTNEQRRIAETFARAGYSLVIGSHPHLAQDVEIVRGTPILYSLGNFAFGSPGAYSKNVPGFSLIARTAFGQDGLQSIELTCIVTDNEIVHFQTRPCSASQSRSLMGRLGTAVTRKDEKGIVELRGRRG